MVTAKTTAAIVNGRLQVQIDLQTKGDSDQPRVPAGSSHGGEFTSGGGSGGGGVDAEQARRDAEDEEEREYEEKLTVKVNRSVVIDEGGKRFSLYRHGKPDDKRVAGTDFALRPEDTMVYSSSETVLHRLHVTIKPESIAKGSDLRKAAKEVFGRIDPSDDAVALLESGKVVAQLESKGYKAVKFTDVGHDGEEHQTVRFLSNVPKETK